ncbi:MAG: polyprenol monophosphomannose synthase [Balneolaceae bacterium]
MRQPILVITPTYNESATIRRLMTDVLALRSDLELLIVDDGSPDGTASIVRDLQVRNPDRIHLIEREGKQGLGSAYLAGFRYALANGYQAICEMDADFSHNPEDLPQLIDPVVKGETDLAIGSRYCKGISIVNWPLRRLILSYTANMYARWVTGVPIQDMTAGFKCIHRRVLETIDLDDIRSNGYAFQIELHFRASMAKFRIREISIIFREREEGVSKMSRSIVREAIWRVWQLRFQELLGRGSSRRSTNDRQ